MDKDVPEPITTRIISQRNLDVDGVSFQWWAVGERPALVTVRAPIFGTTSDFTDGDVVAFAAVLARRVLAAHYQRAHKRHNPADVPVLKKPGWFEPDATDFSTTVF